MKSNSDSIAYTDITTFYSGNKGTWQTAPVSVMSARKSFSHAGRLSPRVKGKLNLRANPYTKDIRNETYCLYSIRTSSDGSTMSTTDYANSVTVSNASVIKKLTAEARTAAEKKFIEKCANVNANLALAIAERKELVATVDTLTRKGYRKLKTYYDLANAIRSMPDRRRKLAIKQHISGASVPGMSKSKDKMADLWLMAIYGIMPVVGDIQTALNHKKMKSFGDVTCSVRRHATTESFTVNQTYARVDFWRDAYVTARAQAQVELNDPWVKMLAEYGLTNPLLLAWERIPYSFLVDWFIGIGGWIQGLSAYHGLVVTNYSITTTVHTMVTQGGLTKKDRVSGNTVDTVKIVQPINIHNITKRRVVSDPPSILTVGSRATWQKFLTSIALTNQRLSKIRK